MANKRPADNSWASKLSKVAKQNDTDSADSDKENEDAENISTSHTDPVASEPQQGTSSQNCVCTRVFGLESCRQLPIPGIFNF